MSFLRKQKSILFLLCQSVSICGFFLFEIIRIFGQKQRQILGLLVNSRILEVRKHLFFAVVDEAGDFTAQVFSVVPAVAGQDSG
jgi:hypothetical protein